MHRRDRAIAIAHEIRLLPLEERPPSLERLCAGDPGLRQEVEAALRAFDQLNAGQSTAPPDADTAAIPSPDSPGDEPLPTRSDPTLPSRIGKYRVLRRLGQGGFGVVYQAISDDGLRKVVALKVLRPGLATPNAVRRFQRERQILPSLHHPNIAGFLDADETAEGQPFFVMEYVEGKPITSFCDQNNLTVRERLALFERICDAVQHAHARFVLHRDLKPSNILVDNDGTPKLLDFGIARLLSRDAEASADLVTIGDEVALTPEYASPEQLRGDPLTTASDVYSLGVLLYELLTGHRPYELQSRVREAAARLVDETRILPPSEKVKTTEEITTASLANEPSTSRNVNPGQVATKRSTSVERLRRILAGDIDNIVLKALRKESVRRYTSAQELLNDLRRHQDGQPVLARGDGWSYRASKFLGRHRVAIGAGVLVATSLSIAGVAYIGKLRSDRELANTMRIEAEARAEKERREALARAELAEGLMHDLVENSAAFGGSHQARRAGLDVVKHVLSALKTEAGDNRELRLQLAKLANAMLGSVNGMISGTLAGDRTLRATAAKEVAAPAISDWEALLAEDPTSPELLIGLAVAQTRQAVLMVQAGGTDAAEKVAATSVGTARKAVTSASSDVLLPQAQLALAGALHAHAKALERRDRTRAAEQWTEALALLLPLFEQDDAPSHVLSLAIDVHSALGLAAESSASSEGHEHLEQGAALYATALALAERWNTLSPSDPAAQRALLNSLQWCARVERQLHHYDKAAEFLQRFDTAAEALRPLDPDYALRLSDISRGDELRGRAYVDQGRDDEATEAFARALDALDEANRAQRGQDILILRRMMNLAASAGESALASGQAERAKSAFERVTAGATKLAEGKAASSMLGCLARAQTGLGFLALRQGDLGEARRSLVAAKGTAEQLNALKEPDARYTKRTKMWITELDGRLAFAGNDLASGRSATEQLLAMKEEEATEAAATMLIAVEDQMTASRPSEWCDLAQSAGASILQLAPPDAEFRSPRLVHIADKLDEIRRRRCPH